MRFISFLIITCISLTTFTPYSYAQTQVSDEKKALIKEMLAETDTKGIFGAFTQNTSEELRKTIKQVYPDVTPENLKLLELDIVGTFEDAINSDSFYEIFYPIYDKYYTVEELREILAFYKTPVGRKTNKVMPQIMQETLQASQIWVQGVIPEVQKRIAKRMEEIKKQKTP